MGQMWGIACGRMVPSPGDGVQKCAPQRFAPARIAATRAQVREIRQVCSGAQTGYGYTPTWKADTAIQERSTAWIGMLGSACAQYHLRQVRALPSEILADAPEDHDCRRCLLCPVLHGGHPFLTRTMGAAVHGPARLDAVAEDAAAAVFTRRGQCLDSTLEAIKGVRPPRYGDVKGFIVIIAANLAPCHGPLLSLTVAMVCSASPPENQGLSARDARRGADAPHSRADSSSVIACSSVAPGSRIARALT